MSESARAGTRIGLRYFEDVLAVEFARIAHRRARRPEGLRRTPVSLSQPRESAPVREKAPRPRRKPRTAPTVGAHPTTSSCSPGESLRRRDQGGAKAGAGSSCRRRRSRRRQAASAPGPLRRDRPFSIRGRHSLIGGRPGRASGALRARPSGLVRLYFDGLRRRLYRREPDGRTSRNPACRRRKKSPFGDGVADSPAVAHLRDYSNYLFPRERSALRNWTDVVAILLRGLVANAVPVSATLLLLAIVTAFAFPSFGDLLKGSYLRA